MKKKKRDDASHRASHLIRCLGVAMEISQAQNCPKDKIFRTQEYAQEMNAATD